MDVFVHIPKTAGSTLRAIISREYGFRRVLYHQLQPGEKENPALLKLLTSLGGTRLITGHHPYGIHAALKRRCRYFSMVRDPIRRAISDYYHAFGYPRHRWRDQILSGKLPIEQYLTDDRYTPGHWQAAMLTAGRWRSPNSLAELAIENVRTGFHAVGTSERFIESVLFIARALGWRPPLFALKNVTRLDQPLRTEREALEAEACARFKEHFEVDYRVYHAIDDLISEKIAAGGALFERALTAFREIEADIAAHTRDRVFDPYEFAGDDVLPEPAARYLGSDPYRKIEEYLKNGDPLPQLGRNYMGRVDIADGQVVAGWAADLSRFEPIDVTIWHAGTIAGVARCDLLREDLARAGLGTSYLGFRCRLKEPIRDREGLVVCFEDTNIELEGV